MVDGLKLLYNLEELEELNLFKELEMFDSLDISNIHNVYNSTYHKVFKLLFPNGLAYSLDKKFKKLKKSQSSSLYQKV